MSEENNNFVTGSVLTPRMETFIRVGSVGTAIIIATCAMLLSYSGLLDLALDAKVQHDLALLVPIMVDGLQFVGSLGVVYSTLSGLRSWYPWTLMLSGVGVSAWGNWQAAPDDVTAQLIHAAAPVILALVLEELLRVMRHKVQLKSSVRKDFYNNVEKVNLIVSDPESSVILSETNNSDDITSDESGVKEKLGTETKPVKKSVPRKKRTVTEVTDFPVYPENVPIRQQVEAILQAQPDLTANRIAKELKRDPSNIRKIIRNLNNTDLPEDDSVRAESVSDKQKVLPLPVKVSETSSSFTSIEDVDPFASPSVTN